MAYDNDYFFWSNVTPNKENRYDDPPAPAWLHQCGAKLVNTSFTSSRWILEWKSFDQDIESWEVPFKQAERILLNWLLIENKA